MHKGRWNQDSGDATKMVAEPSQSKSYENVSTDCQTVPTVAKLNFSHQWLNKYVPHAMLLLLTDLHQLKDQQIIARGRKNTTTVEMLRKHVIAQKTG